MSNREKGCEEDADYRTYSHGRLSRSVLPLIFRNERETNIYSGVFHNDEEQIHLPY